MPERAWTGARGGVHRVCLLISGRTHPAQRCMQQCPPAPVPESAPHGVRRAVMLSAHRGAALTLCIRIHCTTAAKRAAGSMPRACTVALAPMHCARC
ncbi:hypothetical protein XCR_0921 [Xanthomonas campestris pv. raphani 756C]|nr:hypothetical protein XCR_0921 [Xanthomonas campestris pv. raphani 756C]